MFAVPGSILHPGSIGCNQLIQNGAIPLLSVNDILDQLDLARIHEQREARETLQPDPKEQRVLEHLNLEPRHIDDIVRRVNMTSPEVSSLLAMMELKGLVRQVSSMNYVRK